MLKEKDWEKFANYYTSIEIDRKNTKKLLSKFNNDHELVGVIEGLIGENTLDWIERKIPALDNIRPVDCIGNKSKVEKLKKMLMNMSEWV